MKLIFLAIGLLACVVMASAYTFVGVSMNGTSPMELAEDGYLVDDVGNYLVTDSGENLTYRSLK